MEESFSKAQSNLELIPVLFVVIAVVSVIIGSSLQYAPDSSGGAFQLFRIAARPEPTGITCSDTDSSPSFPNGRNIRLQGTARETQDEDIVLSTRTDNCISDTVLQEFSCQNNHIQSEQITCRADLDFTCGNGACIQPEPEPICNDGVDNDNDGFTDFSGAIPAGCEWANIRTDDARYSLTEWELEYATVCFTGPNRPPLPGCWAFDWDNDNDVDYDNFLAFLVCYGSAQHPDQHCENTPYSTEDGAPFQCGDGIDNDNDGAIDFPQDASCVSTQDTTENWPAQCQDLQDNDADGLLNYPDDPDCANRADDSEQFIEPAQTRVFVTSEIFDGALGGLMGVMGADLKCQRAADNAGLNSSFKAWISNIPSPSASQRLPHNHTPYLRLDGAMVAANWSDLTDGSLLAPINIDEFGNTVNDENVWTGTNYTGLPMTPFMVYSCNNWTENRIEGGGGGIGNTQFTDERWTHLVAQSCSAQASLYCIEQSSDPAFCNSDICPGQIVDGFHGDADYSCQEVQIMLDQIGFCASTPDCFTARFNLLDLTGTLIDTAQTMTVGNYLRFQNVTGDYLLLDQVTIDEITPYGVNWTVAYAQPNCNGSEICDNGVDDDSDLLTDCADPNCYADPVCNPGYEAICNDGIDNDGDGYTDCADSACFGQVCYVDGSWCGINYTCIERPEFCQDGMDNDGDRRTDCLDTQDCSQAAACAPGIEICNNGIDDDGDSLVDCQDPNCTNTIYCQAPPTCQQTEICGNGANDDCDEFIEDCGDPDCPACPPG